MIKTILTIGFTLLVLLYITYCHVKTLELQKKDMEEINKKIKEINITVKFIRASIAELEKDLNNKDK